MFLAIDQEQALACDEPQSRFDEVGFGEVSFIGDEDFAQCFGTCYKQSFLVAWQIDSNEAVVGDSPAPMTEGSHSGFLVSW